LTPGSVPFVGTAGLITQDNTNLFFDDTNNRLGINTNTPSNNLDVHGTGTSPLIAINNTAGNQSLIGFAKNSTAKWRIGNSSTDFFEILNVALTTNAIRISSANNSTVFISSVQADEFLIQPTGYSLLASLSRNLTGAGYGVLSLRNSANGTIQPTSLTVDRTYTLPDATGTIALTSNLSAYLPLSGGTLTGNLNIDGENLYIGIDATIPSAIPRLGFVKKSGLQPFLGFAADTLTIKISSGSTIDPTNTYTNALSITTSGVTSIDNLSGTGSRAVLASSSGVLSAPVSDATVKQNIEILKYGLDAIMQLNPISFEYIEDYKDYGEGLQIGNIAQDVAKVIPEAVFTTPSTGLMGINYNQFDGIYIKAIQELNNKIDTLLQKIEYLENK
jgi:hypothetical protein